jgi:predicted ATPase
MRLLAQAGQRTAALAQYATCCHLLDVELGVPPDATTTALYEQIRLGEIDEATSSRTLPVTSESAHPVIASPAHTLPPQPTPFIGRGAELAQIGQLLANPDCRLVTLLGVGGIGKTRLAIEAGSRLAGAFANGVCFVALAGVGGADFVPAVIAQSLGLQTTDNDPLEQVAAHLRPRQLLLILDNLEHLLEAAATVTYLLHTAPRIKVLIASRERLYLREEWLLPVAGLSVADGLVGEAGQLFLRSAQQVHPSFIARGQEEAIAAVCQQVEGMPLAIELAASWVRVMPCGEIARQVVHNFDLLSTPVRNIPERHRSIRALFDQSWRLLSPAEQLLLRRVSVFRGGWTLEEAADVAGATLPLLLGLVDKSMVRANEHGRFDLHEMVRQYAAEQLDASGEGDRIRLSHYSAYLRLLRTADSQLRGPEAVAWFARLEPEQDNVRAALQWALDQARYGDVAWLGVALCHYWTVRGHWYEGARWLEQVLPHGQTLADDLRLAALLALQSFWRAHEDFQAIDRSMGEIMQLLEICPDKLLHAAAWHWVAVSSSEFSQAVSAWEKCITLARAAAASPGPGVEFCLLADGPHLLALALCRYAIRLIDVGENERALLLSTESLKLFQRQGNRDVIAIALGNLGRLALLRGDIEQAHRLLQESVTIALAVGNLLVLGDWQPRLGIVKLYAGEATEARRLLTDSLRLCLDLKNDLRLGRIYAYLAETALWADELDQASQWLAQSLAHHAQPRWLRPETVDCLWVAARLATAQQHHRRAATLFGLAEQVRSQIHYELAGSVRLPVDAALATVRAALDPALFAEAFTSGQQLSLDEAFATFLAPAQAAGTLAAS